MPSAHPSAPAPTRFIDPAVLTRISSLELVARTVVEGFVSGLDWKVYGRLERFFVKEYEGETNTCIHLILDCSRSMDYSRGGIRKLEYGQFLAASLGYFGFKQRDAIGFVSYDEDVREFVPARGSIGHLNTVLHAIERTGPGQKTDFVRPLVSVAERLRRRGIVVLISDLYDDPLHVMEGLRHLAFRGNDVIVFHVLDPVELRFDFDAGAQFVDLETRAEMHVIPEYVRQEYRRLLKDQIAFYERECRKDRMDYALLDTSQPLDRALFTYLLRREQLY